MSQVLVDFRGVMAPKNKATTKRKGITTTITEDMLHIINQHMRKYHTEVVGMTNTLRLILNEHARREKFTIIQPTDIRAPRRKPKI